MGMPTSIAADMTLRGVLNDDKPVTERRWIMTHGLWTPGHTTPGEGSSGRSPQSGRCQTGRAGRAPARE